MQLNFKPTKVPVYEKGDSAGIPDWWRVGTKDSEDHYKARKDSIIFRVKREYYGGKNRHTLYIEHLKINVVKEPVASFEDGFDKANEWAEKHLKDEESLEKFLRDNARKAKEQRLKEGAIKTLEEAKTIKFPYYPGHSKKYEDELIYEVMQKDLNYCVSYYAQNTDDYREFIYMNVLYPKPIDYSSTTLKICNAIKCLLDNLHPAIAKDVEGYFKKISLDEAKSVVFTSGKYRGETLEEVYTKNPGYIEWYLGNVDTTIHNLRLINAMRLLRKSL